MSNVDILDEINSLLIRRGYSTKREDNSIVLGIIPGGHIGIRITCKNNVLSAEILVDALEEYLRDVVEEDQQFDFDEFVDEILSSIRSILLELDRIAKNKELGLHHNMNQAKRDILDAVEEVKEELLE